MGSYGGIWYKDHACCFPFVGINFIVVKETRSIIYIDFDAQLHRAGISFLEMGDEVVCILRKVYERSRFFPSAI